VGKLIGGDRPCEGAPHYQRHINGCSIIGILQRGRTTLRRLADHHTNNSGLIHPSVSLELQMCHHCEANPPHHLARHKFQSARLHGYGHPSGCYFCRWLRLHLALSRRLERADIRLQKDVLRAASESGFLASLGCSTGVSSFKTGTELCPERLASELSTVSLPCGISSVVVSCLLNSSLAFDILIVTLQRLGLLNEEDTRSKLEREPPY